ncbi:MAG: tetratricopeptide repeat protein [Thermogutta sp.]
MCSRDRPLCRTAFWTALAAVWLSGCNLVQRHMRPVRELEVSRQLTQEANFALERGDLQEADRLLVQALRQCKTDAEARALYGEVLWRLEKREAAIQQLKWAVEQAPDQAPIHLRLAEKYLALGHAELARQHAEAAIRISPKSSASWLMQGKVLFALGQTSAAMRAFQRSLDFHPDDPDALARLAECYQVSGQPDRALAAWQAALEKCRPGHEPVEWLIAIAQVYQWIGRHADAAECFALAAARGNGNPDLLVRAGLAHMEAGNRPAAFASLREALANDPRNAAALQLLHQWGTDQVTLTSGEEPVGYPAPRLR